MRLIHPMLLIVLVSMGVSPAIAQPASPPALDPDALFASADTNGDSAITKAEFIAARARSYDRLDRNGDGKLARGEFTGAAPAGIRRNFVASQFSGFDANHDGLLSRAEFNAAPTPGFDRVDADRNGILSAAEVSSARSRR
jgi:Ca2+-binding EF-hand superfamily protein